jgi:hypothetical protein
MRQIYPFHCYGKSPEAAPLVKARVASITAQYRHDNPDANDDVIKCRAVAFLSEVRKQLFEELPSEEQGRWREVAKADRPADDDDRWAVTRLAPLLASNIPLIGRPWHILGSQ